MGPQQMWLWSVENISVHVKCSEHLVLMVYNFPTPYLYYVLNKHGVHVANHTCPYGPKFVGNGDMLRDNILPTLCYLNLICLPFSVGNSYLCRLLISIRVLLIAPLLYIHWHFSTTSELRILSTLYQLKLEISVHTNGKCRNG